MAPRIGEIAVPDALLRGGVARSASGGASSTACRRCGSSRATCSTGCGVRRSPKLAARRRGLTAGDADQPRRAPARARVGIAISVVAIWILVRSVDIAAAFEVLRTASPAWIARDAGARRRSTSRARGARWRALLAPIAPLPYRRVLGYTYIGYLANNVLPARLGELYRSHALGEGEGVSRTTVLGTVVVERVVDTVMVVAIAALAVLVLSVRGVIVERRARRARLRRRCSSSVVASGSPPTGCRAPSGSPRYRRPLAAGPRAGAPAARRPRRRRPAADARRGALLQRARLGGLDPRVPGRPARRSASELTIAQAALMARAWPSRRPSRPARLRRDVRARGGRDRQRSGSRTRTRSRWPCSSTSASCS